MSGIEFNEWPKTPRLNRDIVVTEKIDGTNAAVQVIRIDGLDRVTRYGGEVLLFDGDSSKVSARVTLDEVEYAVVAQSRKRIITPAGDNFGFANWVKDNAETLVADLGEGVHFGEWWGSGIQRGYGLTKGDKRFSLFNTTRFFVEGSPNFQTPKLEVVPVLYEGIWDENEINNALADLVEHGSVAVSEFDRPEGICIYHTAANMVFKVLLENDEIPKSAVA